MKQYLSLFCLITLLAGSFYLVPEQVKAIEGLDIQSGEVSVRHQWTNVTFDTAFTNQPVVFAQIQTENNGQAAYVDLRNTSTTGFQVKVEEDRGRIRTWLNGAHPFETVKWFAFDPTEIVAGYGVESALISFNQANRNAWHNLSFTETYVQSPRVFSQLQSEYNRETARLDQQNISLTGAELKIEEDIGNGVVGAWNGRHSVEDVGYLVINTELDLEDDGILLGSESVDSNWTTICFRADCSDAFVDVPAVFTDIQSENETDVANADIQNVAVAGFEVRIEELANAGWDATHVFEDVAWLAYGEVVPEIPVYEPSDYSVLIVDTGSNTVPIIEGILLGQGYVVDIEATADVYGGIDTDYATVIIPGGEQIVWDAMDASLQAVFQDFADQGGGVIGICGGAIAGSEQASFIDYYGWTTDMLGIGIGVTANYDTAWISYIGGSYNPDVQVANEHEILGGQYAVGETFEMAYRGGPVFTGGTTILSYTEDIDSYPATGQGAVVASEYDGDNDGVAGQVVLFALHPELNADTYFLLENAVQYVIEN